MFEPNQKWPKINASLSLRICNFYICTLSMINNIDTFRHTPDSRYLNQALGTSTRHWVPQPATGYLNLNFPKGRKKRPPVCPYFGVPGMCLRLPLIILSPIAWGIPSSLGHVVLGLTLKPASTTWHNLAALQLMCFVHVLVSIAVQMTCNWFFISFEWFSI